jgi:hypothetical protein
MIITNTTPSDRERSSRKGKAEKEKELFFVDSDEF